MESVPERLAVLRHEQQELRTEIAQLTFQLGAARQGARAVTNRSANLRRPPGV